MEAAYTPRGKEAGAALVCLAEKGCANAKSEKVLSISLQVRDVGSLLLRVNLACLQRNSKFIQFLFYFSALSLTSLRRVARYPCHQPLIWFMAVELSRSEGSMDPPFAPVSPLPSSCSPLESWNHRWGAKRPKLVGRPCRQPVFSRI